MLKIRFNPIFVHVQTLVTRLNTLDSLVIVIEYSGVLKEIDCRKFFKSIRGSEYIE